MRSFAIWPFALAMVLTIANPAQSVFVQNWPVGYYFLTAVPNDDGCFLRSFLIIDPGRTEAKGFPPQIVRLNIKGRFVFETRESIVFPEFTNDSPRGVQYSGSYVLPIPCDEFLYLEITKAVCTINELGFPGGIKEMETTEYHHCLGEMPRQVRIIGTFDPDDPNMLLPLEFPPSAQ